MKMNWTFVYRHRRAYVNERGLIVGEIVHGWGGFWSATRNKRNLGRFIDEDSAKKAVEESLAGTCGGGC